MDKELYKELFEDSEESEEVGKEEAEEEEAGKEEAEEEEADFSKKFNQDFEKQIKKKKLLLRNKETKKLEKYKKRKKIKNIHDLTIGEILINTKNTYFGIFKDLFEFRFDKGFFHIFVKEDRMFYIGVSLLLISFLMFVLSFLLESDKKQDTNTSNEKINIYLNNNKTDIPTKVIPTKVIPTKVIPANTKPRKKITKKIQQSSNNSNSQTKSEDITISSNDLNLNNKIDTSKLKEVNL